MTEMKKNLIRILYATDLHGNLTGYNRLVALAEKLSPDVVINGGDIYPKFGPDDLISLQTEFIRCELKEHFSRFQSLGIPYLFQPGNDDSASLVPAAKRSGSAGIALCPAVVPGAALPGRASVDRSCPPPLPICPVRVHER